MECPYIYRRDLPDTSVHSRDTTLKFAMTGTLTLFSIHLHNQSAIKTGISRIKSNSSKQYLKMRPSPSKANITTTTNRRLF